MKRYFLGLDTSAYTTSVAAVDTDGVLLLDERRLLAVAKGERGLRQSEGVFQHVNNIPILFEGFGNVLSELVPGAIVYSEKPRPAEDSYLPVFRVGRSVAIALSKVLGVPAIAATHQESHVFAGIWSNVLLRQQVESQLERGQEQELLAVHLSGGTSELVHVHMEKSGKLELNRIGATTDLHAGQFVDRVGVSLGLPFPAGPQMEELAAKAAGSSDSRLQLPAAVKGLEISFSGPTTAAMRMISQGAPPAAVAKAVLDCISKTLVRWLRNAKKATGLAKCLLVGGVMSNKFIRQELVSSLEPEGFELFFAEPKYSTDNAIGLAYYGYLLARTGQL